MIDSIHFKKIRLDMIKPFKIALGSTNEYTGYLVKVVTDDGVSGFGEAVPTPIITGDSEGSIEYELNLFSSILKGKEESPELLNDLMKSYARSSRASRAAVDMAVYDIIAKRSKMPLYKLIGNYRKSMETSYTVDLVSPDLARKQAEEFLEKDILIYKIKLGSGIEEDYQRVEAVRSVVGEREIYVDFNQSYTPKNAVYLADLIKKFNVSMIEQPVAAHDVKGMKFVKDNTSISVMADESVYSPEDATRIVEYDAADMINVKLMKSGGITDALKIIDIAEGAGLKTMVGCMVETKLANSAALNVVLGRKNVNHADLDGYSSIKIDVTEKSMTLKKGINYPYNGEGIGAVIRPEYSDF